MATFRRLGLKAILAIGLLAGCAQNGTVTSVGREPLAQEFIGPGSVIAGANASNTLIMESADPNGGYSPDWGFLMSQPGGQ